MNVSLPDSQERFVREQVSSGRYRSASEVVRDGLRMLEEHEHRRLLEKMLYSELSEAERQALPAELLQRFRDRMDALLADARDGASKDGWVGADDVRSRLNDRVADAQRKTAG